MDLVGRSFSFAFEAPLMMWLQSHVGGAALSVVSAFSMLGEELVLILLLGFIYWAWDKKMGKFMGLNILVGIVWNPMIKNVFLRRRPYFDHEGIQILRPVEPEADIYDIAAQGYSFPSGHSSNAVAAYGSVAACEKRNWIRWIAVAVPLLVGFSRVVVGAHYPTDVLAGWLLGTMVLFFVPWLSRQIPNRAALYAVLLVLTLPGILYCRSSDYFSALGLLLGFMAGDLFEVKYVRFENTRVPVRAAARVILGLMLFLALNQALKLPFSDSFLESSTMSAMLVRCGRYAIISFVDFGVYPLAFRWI